MKKELTKEELIEYVKKHGETEVELTDDHSMIGKFKGENTSFHIRGNGYLLSLDGYHYDCYGGNFIVLDYKETGFLADEYEWLKEGDLVDVHEDAYNLGGEKGLVIKKIDLKHHIYQVFNKEGEAEGVCPFHIKPHTPEEVEEMTLEAVCKELGREIKIKK